MKPLLSALGLSVAALLAPLQAHADDYGCKVLLCLGNPNGPMAEQQCQPPIQRMLQGQAKKPPEPFPQCPEANGKAGTKMGTNPYDECPEGTAALSKDAETIQGIPTNPAPKAPVYGLQNIALTVPGQEALPRFYAST